MTPSSSSANETPEYQMTFTHKKGLGQKRGQWRWKLQDAENNRTILASTEGYNNYSDMVANLEECRDYFLSTERGDYSSVIIDDGRSA